MNIKYKNTKNNPFSVPENYFKDFHRELMLRISTQQGNESHKKPKEIRLITTFKNWSYAAVITLIFIIGGTLYVSTATNNIASNNFVEEISNEYIDELLDNYPIDDYTFYCYLTNADSDF